MLFIHNKNSSWYGNGSIKSNIKNLFEIASNNLKKNLNIHSSNIILLPHAGINYSGYCTAVALSHYLNKKNKYNNIIILSTLHKYNSNLIFPNSNSNKGIYSNIKIIDSKVNKFISKYTNCIRDNSFFENEHSHKNIIPFIEYCFPNVPILPILVGDLKNYYTSGKNIYNHFNSSKTLWILCTDLLHVNGRFNYKLPVNSINYEIRKIESDILKCIFDKKSLTFFKKVLKKYQINGVYPSICGVNVLKLFLCMPFNNLFPKVTCYYQNNQLDDILNNNIIDKQSNDSVVSYCSAIFFNKKNISNNLEELLTKFEELELIHYSRSILSNKFFKLPLYVPLYSPSFYIKKGVFVTLKCKLNNNYCYSKGEQLRGCIGTYSTDKKIIDNIHTYTLSAAFNDSRFNNIILEELEFLNLSITLLSSKRKIFKNKNGFKKWRLGKDGIILKYYLNSAIYLPQVPIEQGWNKKKTLESLASKAGLNINDWKKSNCELFIIPCYELI